MPSPRIPAADRVARACFERFALLPKTGRPTAAEWTVLSAVLQYTPASDQLVVVSLGTGTKCLSQDLLSASGDRLNDSHAEVMARRGFVRYLLHEMHATRNEGNGSDDVRGVFTYDAAAKRFVLSEAISFHFFSSHPPCGDASIFDHAPADKQDADDDNGPSERKRRKIEASDNDHGSGDVLRGFTGGKLVSTAEPDAVVDLMAQQLGAVRTKPGRGIRTLSVSCSDKLSRWSLVGMQGAMLHALLAAGGVYVESVTMAGVCDINALERAIWRRWPVEELATRTPAICWRRPAVQRASDGVVFAHEQSDGLQPAPASVVWCRVPNKDTEVAVAGKRQGVTKKKLCTPTGRLKICKIELLRQYQQLVLIDYPEIGAELGVTAHSTYEQVKRASTQYTYASEVLKTSYFKCWTTKPRDLNAFHCD